MAGVCVGGNAGTRKRQLGAADEFAVGFFDEIGGGGETFGLSRCEDEEGFGKIALHYAED